MATYPGGKKSDGVYHRIINQIPPHETYIEAFAGSAAILRYKRPATVSFVLDLSKRALDALADDAPTGTILACGDGVQFLESFPWAGNEFAYVDPPYLLETRKSGKLFYTHEMEAPEQHERLLDVILRIPSPVMISGYWSELYAERLAAWRTDSFTAGTRGGPATEWLWMNYPEPDALHDYQYLGRNFRERENFARQRKRWLDRLRRMPRLKRKSLLAALADLGQASPAHLPFPPSPPARAPPR